MSNTATVRLVPFLSTLLCRLGLFFPHTMEDSSPLRELDRKPNVNIGANRRPPSPGLRSTPQVTQ